MRIAIVVLLLIVPLASHADTRVSVQTAGGIEVLMLGDTAPGGVVEAGIVLEHVWADKRWGPAVMFDRVGRTLDKVADEWELDAGIAFANSTRTERFVVGLGIRQLTMPGGENRLPSTIKGFDLFRMAGEIQMVRRGPISLDFTLGWTVGLYHGERYNERIGDVAQTTRPVTLLTNSYTLGVQTTVVLD